MRSKFQRANARRLARRVVGLCGISAILLVPLLHAAESSSRQVALDKLAQDIERDHPEISHISLDELRRERANITLIDVCEPQEYAVSRIPGAINISDPEALLAFTQSHDKPLVLYCSVGRRSADLTNYLHQQGVSHASNFVGSIFAWGNAGLKLVDDQGETEKVHPYNWFWGWQYLDDKLHASKPRR